MGGFHTAPRRTFRRATILRRWIIWSTFLGCFSGSFFLHVGSVHLLYFYPIMTLNLVLLTVLGRLWFPPGLLLLLGFTLFSGVAGIAQGTLTLALLMKSMLGVWLSSVYMCAFVRYIRFDAVTAFRRYAILTYWFSLLGILLLPYQVWILGAHPRLYSLQNEPAEFCTVCMPGLYYFADRWQREKVDGSKFLIMLAAYILAQSSVGFLGIFVGLILFVRRYRFGLILGPFVVLLAGLATYTTSTSFQLRFDDSITGFRDIDGSGINPSSFSLLSGAFVATQALIAHPLMGEGFGGISMVNSRYIEDLPGSEVLPDEIRMVASGDGGSMLFRLAGETGLVGLSLALGFLWYCFPRRGGTAQEQTATAILVYCFTKLLRSGIYFNPEVMFLLCIYAVNGSALLARARQSLQERLGHNALVLPLAPIRFEAARLNQ